MKPQLKAIIGIIIVALMLSSITGCRYSQTAPTSDMEQQIKTEQLMRESNRQIGMPAIVNNQEKKLMKQIYELRDQENLMCYAYLFNKEKGTVGQFIGNCIGYGLPYSTQFSNPQKLGTVEGDGYGRNPYTLPQPEPNGLFMPEGLSATWLLLIDPDTKEPRPVYIEPEIIVSPFKMHDVSKKAIKRTKAGEVNRFAKILEDL